MPSGQLAHIATSFSPHSRNSRQHHPSATRIAKCQFYVAGLGTLLTASLFTATALSMPRGQAGNGAIDVQGAVQSAPPNQEETTSHIAGISDAPQIAKWLKELGSHILAERENALKQLAAAREHAMPDLARGAVSREPSVRESCMSLLIHSRDAPRRAERDAAEQAILSVCVNAEKSVLSEWRRAEETWRRTHRRKAEAVLAQSHAFTLVNRQGQLSHVRLDGAQYDDAFLLHLRAVPTVRTLVIARSSITFEGLLTLRQMPGLASVRIEDNIRMTAGEREEVNVALRSCVFWPLDDRGKGNNAPISNSEASIQAALLERGFALAINERGFVHSVELSGGRLTEADAQLLGQLRFLTHLVLVHTEVVSPKAWSQLALLSSLRDLHFSKCGVKDQNLKAISRIQTLQYLALDEPEITDAGVSHLVALPLLSTLSISTPQVSDASLRTMQRIRYLNFVDVSNTRFSKYGIQILSERFPSLQVNH